MVKLHFRLGTLRQAFLLASLLFTIAALAQTSPQIEPAIKMPTDPKTLMDLAAESNGLAKDGIKPWHLTLSFQTMDDKGNIKDKGTIEESWVGTHKYKRTSKTDTMTLFEYGTEKGVLRSGPHDPPGTLLESILDEFDQPFPNEKARENWILELKDRQSGEHTLKCLQVKAFKTPAGDRPLNGPIYCLDPDKPYLRIVANPVNATQILYNNRRLFQGQSFPGDIESHRDGKIEFKAHLEHFEQIDTADEAAFTPPSDATLVERKISISAAVAQGQLIKNVTPEYPPYAKAAGIQGVVTLRATIGKDGHVTNVHAANGPSQLQQAAEKAVRYWVYKPYLLDGEPVTVETVINVVFSLGR
jgi:TonB family protein